MVEAHIKRFQTGLETAGGKDKAARLAGIDPEDEIAVAKALNAINGEWDAAGLQGELKYMAQLQAVADMQATSVTVELDDLAAFEDGGAALAAHVASNTWRYTQLFAEAIDSLLPGPTNPVWARLLRGRTDGCGCRRR